MKHLVLLAAMLITVGCQHNSMRQVLVDADNIMESHPDSALKILHENAPFLPYNTRADSALYFLLLTQAEYKCYKEPSCERFLNLSIDYFRHTKDHKNLARAYYYKGMIAYERGSHSQAVELLKKGETLSRRINDLLQKSKFHESLCMVNYHAKNDELMLHYAQLFLEDALQLEDTVCIARGLNTVSVAFARLKHDSLAHQYLEEILPYIDNVNDTLKACILTNLGCIYHSANNLPMAKYYLQKSLSFMPRANTYAELGDIYAEEGNPQDAEECWDRALSSDNPSIRVNTLSSILNKHKQQRNYARALATAEKLYSLKDSLYQLSELSKITEIQKRYDKQVVENKLYKTLTWFFATVSCLLVILICFIIYHRHTVKVYVSKLDLHFQTIQERQKQIDQLENENKLLGTFRESHNHEIDALRKKITDIRREAYENLGYGRQVYEAVSNGKPLRFRREESGLIDYYSVFHYEIFHRWMTEYNDLSDRLITYLILVNQGKSDKEIEQILSIGNSAIRSIKSRLRARKLPV